MSANKSGCYVDEDDVTPMWEDCVIDYGDYEQCVHAHPGITKEDCKHWREITGSNKPPEIKNILGEGK